MTIAEIFENFRKGAFYATASDGSEFSAFLAGGKVQFLKDPAGSGTGWNAVKVPRNPKVLIDSAASGYTRVVVSIEYDSMFGSPQAITYIDVPEDGWGSAP